MEYSEILEALVRSILKEAGMDIDETYGSLANTINRAYRSGKIDTQQAYKASDKLVDAHSNGKVKAYSAEEKPGIESWKAKPKTYAKEAMREYGKHANVNIVSPSKEHSKNKAGENYTKMKQIEKGWENSMFKDEHQRNKSAEEKVNASIRRHADKEAKKSVAEAFERAFNKLGLSEDIHQAIDKKYPDTDKKREEITNGMINDNLMTHTRKLLTM